MEENGDGGGPLVVGYIEEVKRFSFPSIRVRG
jgi:hypothetical protein